ncbi:MAG: archease [Nitrospiraceae bacterium]|jgi:SHS2 domain-containing protein|nr:MAG: archease [Nitrospiraceae bacterium]
MKPFELIDISGDAGIRAFGNDLKELFLNAAAGMYSLITNSESVTPRKSIEIETSSDSLEGLLVSWLNELIFHFDAYGFIGKEIHIHELRDTLLRATVTGEDFVPERHGGGLLIKAATYHRLKIERKEGHWEADVIFDI